MASIYQRRKENGKWRYVRVNLGRGRRPAEAPPYYIRFTLNGKRQWSDPYPTIKAAEQAAGELPDVKEAVSRGISLHELTELRNADRVPIRVAVDRYLAQKANKAKKTIVAYQFALAQFVEATTDKVGFLDEITVEVLRKFKHALEVEGYSGSSIKDRLMIVTFMLKKNGIAVRLPLDEMPTVEEEPAVPYSDEELSKLFAAMKDQDRILYKFFLGTACRSKEVKYASWNDVNFDKETFTVRSKPDAGFTVKNHESRAMRIPTSLVQQLKERKRNAPHERWMFVNGSGEPDNHFLRRLKEIALRAGLNCGQCRTVITKGKYEGKHKVEVTCKTEAVCEHIFLHRLRKTCATRWHEAGIPIRTIQAWLGHKNLETTMLYLGVTDAAKLGPQVNKAFGD